MLHAGLSLSAKVHDELASRLRKAIDGSSWSSAEAGGDAPT
jgi:hypothetical protein